jgi:Ca2+/Na+ antiporter
MSAIPNIPQNVRVSYLGLELLVLLLLLGLVVGYLLLGFIASFPDALGAVYRSVLDGLIIASGEGNGAYTLGLCIIVGLAI